MARTFTKKCSLPRLDFLVPAVFDLVHHLLGQSVCDAVHEIQ